MVSRAVALDANDEFSRVVWMTNSKVNLETGNAHLHFYIESAKAKPIGDFDLKVAVRFITEAFDRGRLRDTRARSSG
jgi:hypothetical protein